MVKVAQMSIPPEYESLLAKVLAFFDNQIYPTWAGRFFHKTRSAKKALKEKTFMPSSADAWKLLTADEKLAWKTTAWWASITTAERTAWKVLNRYQLFFADYSYRRKNGLSLLGVPAPLHEMMGLEIQNPAGAINVRLRRDQVDLVGPISIAFTYKKTEIAPTASVPFKFIATAYYFENGQNLTETLEWSVPSGNVDWVQVTQSFGTAGRKFFHLTLIWYLDAYDAVIDIDHLLIKSNGAVKYLENWAYKSGKVWEYANLYRKTGWLFTPTFWVPYFDVLYLG